jgi:histidinol dehydrogenase
MRRLATRLAALENIDHAAFRARTRQAFGKPLRPDEVVARILADVRARGDQALLSYARRIDGVALTARTLRVSPAERRAAYKRTAPAVRVALELSVRRIADYQERLMPAPVHPRAARRGPPGVKSGMMWTPLRRVGLYVPAGTAPLVSSVPMLAVPAMVAGVKEIAVATPCSRSGAVNDGVLCACEILGLQEIYKLGGAQAIAALAFGTRTVPRVEKIAGPGNLFVLLAKRAVFGHVDIDMLAGPSEVLIIADDSANPAWLAADLLSQAEHDVLASCVLVTTSRRVAEQTAAEVARQLDLLPRKAIAAAALRDWGLILVARNLDEAVEAANQFAPEHLEVQTRAPGKLVPKLTTAGAIFAGPYAPEPLGDYLAGPSHVLPTGGTARAFSGVSVYTFLRRTSVIEADARGLAALAAPTEALAAAESLEAHRRATAIRQEHSLG